MSVIDGRVRVEHGVLLDVDVERLVARHNRIARARRLGVARCCANCVCMTAALLLVAALAAAVAEPTPAPTAVPDLNLPEIGRVRSVTPPCAVMRDIVVPSWAAARKADERFAQASKKLPDYARTVDDNFTRWSVQREMQLSRLDTAVSQMMEDAMVINKALGDPRIAANVNDPQVRGQRDQLQQVYATQMARASVLNEFVQRERYAVMTHDLNVGSAFNGHGTSFTPTPTPQPGQTASPFGQPALNGIWLNDQESMRNWTTAIATAVRASENKAAQSFLEVARDCR
ncbi:MAG: hypothetical protein ABR591_04945 [Candidatus Velthaea sp.]